MKKNKILWLLCGLFSYDLVFAESSSEPVYLDYAAAVGINQKSLDEFNRIAKMRGNSSGFNSNATALKEIENNAAKIIAKKLNCEPNNILFTCSATMSNNVAILGVAYKYPAEKCHLITSKIDHKSVLNVFKHLEEKGYKVTYLNVDRFGRIDLDQLQKSITKNTKLVSIQSFNSEIGITQNLQEISKIVRAHPGVLMHSDIAQSFGKYPIDVTCLDLATFSGYKIGSPKGIAALYIKDANALTPIAFGSGKSLWPGSVPTELVAAFGVAVKNYKMDFEKIKNLFNVLRTEIQKIDNVFINSAEPSHVFSVSISGVLLKDVINELNDFAFSSGCSCLGKGESNVKEAIDPDGKLPSCTLRISFADAVDQKIMINFAKRLNEVVSDLRKRKKITEGCENKKSSQELADVLANLEIESSKH